MKIDHILGHRDKTLTNFIKKNFRPQSLIAINKIRNWKKGEKKNIDLEIKKPTPRWIWVKEDIEQEMTKCKVVREHVVTVPKGQSKAILGGNSKPLWLKRKYKI